MQATFSRIMFKHLGVFWQIVVKRYIFMTFREHFRIPMAYSVLDVLLLETSLQILSTYSSVS